MSAGRRRALYALGGLTGLGVTVDLRPDVGLVLLAPGIRLGTGIRISSDKVIGPLHAGTIVFQGLNVRRPSPKGRENEVTDMDLRVQHMTVVFRWPAVTEKRVEAIQADGIRGRVRLAAHSPPFQDGVLFGSIKVSDVDTDVCKFFGTSTSSDISVRVDKLDVENIKISKHLPLDMMLKCLVEGSVGERGKESRFWAQHGEDNSHEWHCEKVPFEEVHPLALEKSRLPLNWLTGSFDLHIKAVANVGERPVKATLQCDAKLHGVQAVVPESYQHGAEGLASATVVHYVNAQSGPEYNLSYTVAFDEAALSQADGMWSSGAAVVLGSLCDAMATRAVSSWLDTARDWVSFAITVFSGNSKET